MTNKEKEEMSDGKRCSFANIAFTTDLAPAPKRQFNSALPMEISYFEKHDFIIDRPVKMVDQSLS
ncbi:MAG: hypothetical protein ACRDAM_06530 [Casimicrobium sp.]